MLKNKKDRPCDCGSGKKYGKCCGDQEALNLIAMSERRKCGDCQACCDLVGVMALGKPYGTTCEHQCSSGCGIYASRPHGCRIFFCSWKLFINIPDEMRPDRSGIMVCFDTNIMKGDDRPTLMVYEVWEGAFKTIPVPIYAEMTRVLQELPDTCLALIPFGKRQPPDFEVAEQYSYHETYSQNIYQMSDRGIILVDTEEEGHLYQEQLNRK